MKYIFFACVFLIASCNASEKEFDINNSENQELKIDFIARANGGFDEKITRRLLLPSETIKRLNEQKKISLNTGSSGMTADGIDLIEKNGNIYPISLENDFSAEITNNKKITTYKLLKKLQSGDGLLIRTSKYHPPVMGKYLSLSHYLLPSPSIANTRITLQLPKKLESRVDFKGFDKTDIKHDYHSTTYSFEHNVEGLRFNNIKSAGYLDDSPRLVASSIQSYQHLATEVEALFKEPVNVPKSLFEITQAVTNYDDNQLQMVNKLYRWVQENIGYTDKLLNEDGITPHSVKEILEARRGDCKDHVVLLRALLASRGISSSPVLVTTSSNFVVSRVPTLQEFDHVVLYVPSIKTYLDSTSQLNPVGILDPVLAGKPALNINSGKLSFIPNSTPSDANKISTKISFDKNGNMHSITTAAPAGYAIPAIRRLEKVFSGDTKEIVSKTLKAHGIKMPGGKIYFDVNPISGRSTLNLEAYGNEIVDLKNSTKISVNHYLRIPYSLSFFQTKYTLTKPPKSFLCGAFTIEENYEVELPEKIATFLIPDGKTFDSGPLSYRSIYRISDNRIFISRKLVNASEVALCDSSQYASFQAITKFITEDMQAQITILPKNI